MSGVEDPSPRPPPPRGDGEEGPRWPPSPPEADDVNRPPSFSPSPPGGGGRGEGSGRLNTVVLFALEREASLFRRVVRGRPDIHIVITGIGHAAAAKAVAGVLAGPRPGLVVMAGFGGALRDGLAVGDVVTPAEVVDDRGGRWVCAAGEGRLLTAAGIAATPDDKRSLGDRHGADVVDMESAAVAAACAAAGVPFRAVRAISDPVHVGLSPRLAELFASGQFSPWRAALALLRQPSLVAEFWRLARDTRIAADRLAAALGAVVGPP